MKPIFWIIVGFLVSPLISMALFAGTGALAEPTVDEWIKFLASLKGVTGLGTLSVAAAVVQGALFLFRSQFLPLDGRKKIMIVQALSIAAGVIGLRLQNFDWISSFIHANTMGAVQVFLHQIYKQFTDLGDKYETPKVR